MHLLLDRPLDHVGTNAIATLALALSDRQLFLGDRDDLLGLAAGLVHVVEAAGAGDAGLRHRCEAFLLHIDRVQLFPYVVNRQGIVLSPAKSKRSPAGSQIRAVPSLVIDRVIGSD